MQWARENKERHLQNRRNHYSRNSASEIARVRKRQGKIKQGNMSMNKAEQAEVQGMYDFCKIFKMFETRKIGLQRLFFIIARLVTVTVRVKIVWIVYYVTVWNCTNNQGHFMR
jgi:hypothetical protein